MGQTSGLPVSRASGPVSDRTRFTEPEAPRTGRPEVCPTPEQLLFDEVNQGTALFKVTSSPPAQGHFVGLEGLPSDWYLRLVGEAASRLRQQQRIPREIPFTP